MCCHVALVTDVMTLMAFGWGKGGEGQNMANLDRGEFHVRKITEMGNLGTIATLR